MYKEQSGNPDSSAKVHTKTFLQVRGCLDELPPDLFDDLLKIYLIDFHLFGYDIPAQSSTGSES
jgi:hypothetical protein